MKQVLVRFLAVSALCACIPAPGRAAISQAEFKTMIENYWATWSALDPDRSAAMYSKDADAVFFDISPLKYNGWAEYADGVKKVFAGAATAKFAPNDDVKGVEHGNFAWTSDTFKGTIHQKDGKTMEMTGRHTAIWEKRGGKWLIVHEHVSVPLAE